MKRYLDRIIGPARVFSRGERSLNTVLFFTILVSISTLVKDLLSHEFTLIDLYTVFNLLVFSVLYIRGRRKPGSPRQIFAYFFFSFLILFWVWFSYGGISLPFLLLCLGLLGITTLVTQGGTQKKILILILILAGALVVIDLKYPDFVSDQESGFYQLFDPVTAIVFVVIGFLSLFTLVHFDQWERQRLAEEKSRSRERFISILAHDLKGSVGRIVSMSEMVLAIQKKSAEREQSELDQLILDSSRTTYQLLENLLSWSNAQSGLLKAVPEMVSVLDMVEANLQILYPELRRKQIGITRDIDPEIRVYVDEQMLHTVIRNLMTNAVKFTPDGGEIILRARTNRTSFQAEISVEDKGLGMEESVLETLFDVGNRSSREGTRGETGTGMGLILCKELISMNHGSIRAESTIGEGSVFTLVLPSR